MIKAPSQCQVYQIESQTAPRPPTKVPDINQRAIFQGRRHGRTGHLSLFSVPATVAHVESNYSWWCRVRVRMARAAPGDGVNAGGDGHPCLEIQTTSCRLHLLPESQGITEKYFPFEVLSPRIYIKCPLYLQQLLMKVYFHLISLPGEEASGDIPKGVPGINQCSQEPHIIRKTLTSA